MLKWKKNTHSTERKKKNGGGGLKASLTITDDNKSIGNVTPLYFYTFF